MEVHERRFIGFRGKKRFILLIEFGVVGCWLAEYLNSGFHFVGPRSMLYV